MRRLKKSSVMYSPVDTGINDPIMVNDYNINDMIFSKWRFSSRGLKLRTKRDVLEALRLKLPVFATFKERL